MNYLRMQNEIFQEEWLESEPIIGNMWANINPPGGYNRPHLHPNSHFSGVYYIKAPENSGQIVFNEPRSWSTYGYAKKKRRSTTFTSMERG